MRFYFKKGLNCMEQEFLLREGFTLMFVGLGIVFAFLVVMIIVMSFSRFFERFSYLLPDPIPPAPAAKPRAPAGDGDTNVAIAVAIAVANKR